MKHPTETLIYGFEAAAKMAQAAENRYRADAAAEIPGLRADVRRRPGILGDPAAGDGSWKDFDRGLVADVNPERGFVHDARVDALQPMFPPAHFLVHPGESGSRIAVIGIIVRPRPDQTLAGNLQVRKQARIDVDEMIGQSADGINGTFDAAVIDGDGGVSGGLNPGELARAITMESDPLQPGEPRSLAFL